LKIKDLMTRDVESVDPQASLEEAAQLMSDADVGAVPVVEEGRVIGVLTDRDIVVRAVSSGLDPSEAKVGDVMTPEVVHCHEDDEASDAAGLMEEHQIRRVVVTDGDGALAGILSLGDLAARLDGAGRVLREVSRPSGRAGASLLAVTDELDAAPPAEPEAPGAGAAPGGDFSFLVKDELAAVETYRQALRKVSAGPAGEDLRRIETEHEEAARLLQERMRAQGLVPPATPGLWGAFAEAVEGAAKLFGTKAALKALKEGEEHGIHDYEDALEDAAVPAEVKELISTTLLPRTRAHVPVLDRHLGAGL
jgi:CBS domain-containing protein